jgi:hypothetical protein
MVIIMQTKWQKVLSKKARWTQSFVANTISISVKRVIADQGYSDQDLADIIGCSASTVKNAREAKGQLQPYSLFKLLEVSPSALEGLLHHFDRRSVPLRTDSEVDALTSTADVLHKLALASRDGRDITDSRLLELESSLDVAVEALCSLKTRCVDIREARS